MKNALIPVEKKNESASIVMYIGGFSDQTFAKMDEDIDSIMRQLDEKGV